MDSDDESDAVIISCKPSSTATPANGTATASPVKRSAPISFASIAGALKDATTSASSGSSAAPTPAAAAAASNGVESAPVAVKA